jgi:Mrp family chromosome partitioning ATPase
VDEVSRRNDTDGAPGEEPIELRRYLDALRRSLPLIVGIVVVLAASSYAVSRSLTKHYRAQASIVKQQLAVTGETQAADALSRELNTINTLLETNEVLGAAAQRLGGETASSLRDKVRSRVDPNANLIYVGATDSDPRRAAAIANTVAHTFVAKQLALERREAELARAGLQHELNRLRGRRGTAVQVQAIQQRISDLGIRIATAGSDLAVAARATPPTEPETPHPARNGLLGIVLGLFLGVLVALARDQLAPRVGSPRELSRLLELPVLGSIPRARRRRRPAVAHEAYRTLASAVRFSLPITGGSQVVLVTSALDGEGKSTVSAGLAGALAHAGHRTLLVSADLSREPPPHVPHAAGEPGLSELLPALATASRGHGRDLVQAAVRSAPTHPAGRLDVLPGGSRGGGDGRLLSEEALEAFLPAVSDLGYDYVLLDGPPLLGSAEAQALAYRAPSTVYVARLDRSGLEDAIDARDVLDRIECRPIGIVVVAARGESSTYHLGGRVAALEEV